MGTSFNREAWLRRIWDSRVRRGAASSVGEEIKCAMDYAAVLGIEALSTWLQRRGFALNFAKRAGAVVDTNKKIVTISSHMPVQKQLHLLIHECGHILISSSSEDKYPHGYKKIEEAKEGRGELHKIDVLGEEFEAWQKGRKLASRLGIHIDIDEFDKTRAKCLKTYVHWASRRGRVSDE